MDGFDTEFKFNSPTHVRHLQNLVDLQKDKTFDYSGRTNTGEGRFTSGECPIMLTSSGFYGNVKANAKFEFGAAPMPYYPDVAGRAAELDHRRRLAVGHGRQEGRGIQGRREVLHVPLRHRPPGQAAHEVSGYLPITKAAYEQDQGLGLLREESRPRDAAQQLNNKEPTENSRGLRFGNMVQIRDIWAEEIEAALPARSRPGGARRRRRARQRDAAPVRAHGIALT
jgi:sn-glycerol 3-phosphate transport system substrate-binding protein